MTDFLNFLSTDHQRLLGPLLKAMPQLLMHLIKPHSVQSLERLQLLNITCEIAHESVENADCHFDKIAMKLDDGPNKLLTLSGELMSGEQLILVAKITYFMRGQRKFFKPDIKPHGEGVKNEIGLLNLQDIKNFYQKIDCDNDFFTSEKIARLNGLASPVMPTEFAFAMLAAACLGECLKLGKISVDFIDCIRIGQKLSIHFGAAGEVTLLADDEPKARALGQ